MAKKLPPAWDWENRNIENWNAVTFHNYMKYLHPIKYGTPYPTTNKYMMIQNKNIKRMYTEHGREVTKRFIDLCFDKVKPGSGYAAITFNFLYAYHRERFLPLAVRDIQRMESIKDNEEEVNKSKEELSDIADNF